MIIAEQCNKKKSVGAYPIPYCVILRIRTHMSTIKAIAALIDRGRSKIRDI